MIPDLVSSTSLLYSLGACSFFFNTQTHIFIYIFWRGHTNKISYASIINSLQAALYTIRGWCSSYTLGIRDRKKGREGEKRKKHQSWCFPRAIEARTWRVLQLHTTSFSTSSLCRYNEIVRGARFSHFFFTFFLRRLCFFFCSFFKLSFHLIIIDSTVLQGAYQRVLLI